MSLRLQDIKKGEVFYECERGRNIQMTALEDARRVIKPESFRDGWECEVVTELGNLTLFEAIDPGGYGLRLYAKPAYVERKHK